MKSIDTTLKRTTLGTMIVTLVMMSASLSAQDPLELPVTFDDPDVTYLPMNDFGGTETVLAEDPEDPDNTVAMTTRSAEAVSWAGSAFVLAEPIPFAEGETTMSFKVYAPEAGISVSFKIEQSDGDAEHEINQELEEANTWVTMEYDFAGALDGDYATEYDVIAVFFNFGVDGADVGEQVYYWDEVAFVADGNGNGEMRMPDLPLTFDDPNVEYLPMNDFGGVTTELGEDPDNPDNTVAISTREASAQGWGGSAITLANPIPFASDAQALSMRARSPQAGVEMNLKLEQSDGSEEIEVQATITEADTWETLIFYYHDHFEGDFSTEYDVIAFMPNYFPEDEPGDQVFYWDDVELFISTSVAEEGMETPRQMELMQNYPNPFNPTTTIGFRLPEQSEIRLNVYNMIGQQVATLAQGTRQAGNHTVQFDASQLSSGMYLYRLYSGDQVLTNKMLLIK